MKRKDIKVYSAWQFVGYYVLKELKGEPPESASDNQLCALVVAAICPAALAASIKSERTIELACVYLDFYAKQPDLVLRLLGVARTKWTRQTKEAKIQRHILTNVWHQKPIVGGKADAWLKDNRDKIAQRDDGAEKINEYLSAQALKNEPADARRVKEIRKKYPAPPPVTLADLGCPPFEQNGIYQTEATDAETFAKVFDPKQPGDGKKERQRIKLPCRELLITRKLHAALKELKQAGFYVGF